MATRPHPWQPCSIVLDLSRGVDPRRLQSAIEWANTAYYACNVCPENCGINRHEGEVGFCGLGADAYVYKEYLHMGEESALTPSHTVFLSGCNFRCAFCSDMGPVKSPTRHGFRLSPEKLAARIALRRKQGATNVNFVGGLPDVNVLFILRTLDACPADTHVVFNTNLWTTQHAIERLSGIVGTWLVDFKFGSDRCAKKLSGTAQYTEHMQALLPLVEKNANALVRHLIMPGHLECCTRPVFEWLSTNMPHNPVNVMTHYHPFGMAAGRSAMSGPNSQEDVNIVLALAEQIGLRYITNGVDAVR